MQSSNYNIFYSNNHLLYNSFSQCLLEISPNIYEILIKGNLNQLDEETFNLFLKKKIITKDYEYERTQLDNEIQRATSSHKLITVVLSLTSLCNLNCWYCIQSERKSKNKMNLLELDKWNEIKTVLIKSLIRDETERVNVVLYGGEPMLNKRMIKQIIEDLNVICNKKVTLNYTLITNGTLLEDADILIEMIDKIQITIDTTEEIHDYNRPFINGGKSFNIIYNSLKKYAYLYPNKFNLRMNIDAEKINNAKKMLSKLKADGLNNVLKYIVFCPIIDNQSKSCRVYDEKIEETLYELYKFAIVNGFKITQQHTYGLCSAYNDASLCVDENLDLYMCIGFMYEKSIGIIKDSKIKKEQTKINMTCIINDKCKFYPICLGGSPCGIKCPKEYYEKFFPKYLMLKYGVTPLQNEEEQND